MDKGAARWHMHSSRRTGPLPGPLHMLGAAQLDAWLAGDLTESCLGLVQGRRPSLKHHSAELPDSHAAGRAAPSIVSMGLQMGLCTSAPSGRPHHGMELACEHLTPSWDEDLALLPDRQAPSCSAAMLWQLGGSQLAWCCLPTSCCAAAESTAAGQERLDR